MDKSKEGGFGFGDFEARQFPSHPNDTQNKWLDNQFDRQFYGSEEKKQDKDNQSDFSKIYFPSTLDKQATELEILRKKVENLELEVKTLKNMFWCEKLSKSIF